MRSKNNMTAVRRHARQLSLGRELPPVTSIRIHRPQFETNARSGHVDNSVIRCPRNAVQSVTPVCASDDLSGIRYISLTSNPNTRKVITLQCEQRAGIRG